MTSPVPFPWQSLRRVHRGEAAAVRRLRGLYSGVLAGDAARLVAELSGHPTRVAVRTRALVARAEPFDRGPVVALETPHGRVHVEVDAEIALAIVGALAGARTLPRVARERSVPPEVEGALAGAMQWLARGMGVEADVLSTVPALRGDVLRVDVGVDVGALRGRARIAAEVPESGPEARELDVLARLGAMPLSARVVGARRPASAGELSRVAVGDIVLVEGLALTGPCLVAVGAHCFDAELIEPMGPTRRIRLGSRHAGADPEGTMTVDVVPPDAAAMLELEVEFGTVTLPAHAWAATPIGAVVSLDPPPGAPVTLRVSGASFALGELVEVDGQVGVLVHDRRA